MQTLLALVQSPMQDSFGSVDPHTITPPKGNPAIIACLREHFVRIVFLAHGNLDGKETCWDVPDEGQQKY